MGYPQLYMGHKPFFPSGMHIQVGYIFPWFAEKSSPLKLPVGIQTYSEKHGDSANLPVSCSTHPHVLLWRSSPQLLETIQVSKMQKNKRAEKNTNQHICLGKNQSTDDLLGSMMADPCQSLDLSSMGT